MIGVIGAIDGTHIPIKAPFVSHNSHVNRKGAHSVVLQGVCDHELLFTDCYAGEVEVFMMHVYCEDQICIKTFYLIIVRFPITVTC